MPAKGKGRAKAASSHQLASNVPVGTEMKDLRKKSWFVGEPIGSGGFGLIYLAGESKESISKEKAQHVIKVEPQGNGPLFCEIAFYQRAARKDTIDEWKKKSRLSYVGIPAYVAHGLHKNAKEELRFMVMPRYGSDLHSLWLKANKKFRRETVCQLAIELINALEYMHTHEYVHADVKGGNILLGYNDPNQIYLVDFGLAYRYLVEGEQKHYQEDPKKAHDGTIEYTSRDAHLGVAPSRRSDMEILGYVLLHWLSGKLPWEDKLSDKNYVKQQKIEHMKNVKGFVASVFPEGGISGGNEIEKFLQYVANLQYDQEPDYCHLRQIFKDSLKSMGVNAKAKISFEGEEEPCTSKSTQRKRRGPAEDKKPLKSETNSQSPEPKDEVPQKKYRRAAARKKQRIETSTDEEDSESVSEPTPVKKSYSKKKVAKGRKPAAKGVKPSKMRTVVENVSDGPDNSSSLADEVNTSDSISCENDVVKKIPEKKKIGSKSRYSMAPLHTQSVLGKNDVLTGKSAGKHPVIMRKRKVNREKADAVTQTTPSLRKRASRV